MFAVPLWRSEDELPELLRGKCRRLITARCTGGGCGMDAGSLPGAAISLRFNSAWTSIPSKVNPRVTLEVGRDRAIPFSSKMRSSSEFLYLNMRHSSAADR